MAEEKLHAEVAAKRYIADNTTIPVPFILHYGMQDESPGGLGPFFIMEYIDNAGDVVDLIQTPGRPAGEKPVLDPEMDEAKLELVYSQAADIMLQLAQCNLSRIGSLGTRKTDEDDEFSELETTSRPFTFNIAQLGEVGGIPHFELSPLSKTFSSSSEYYSALADMHLQQLSFQRNQAVRSADERRLPKEIHRELAAEHRIGSCDSDGGPFKLWCDDLRPANILVDAEHRIVGVIDWEFTYAASVEFTYSPPWWLLLIMPEEWPQGLDDWTATYEPRLQTFLRAMEAKEREFIEQGRLDESQLSYAARKSWAFDGIFWRSIDERFFGKKVDGFMDRLKLLPSQQADAMEDFVERKMREKEECTSTDWYTGDHRNRYVLTDCAVGSAQKLTVTRRIARTASKNRFIEQESATESLSDAEITIEA